MESVALNSWDFEAECRFVIQNIDEWRKLHPDQFLLIRDRMIWAMSKNHNELVQKARELGFGNNYMIADCGPKKSLEEGAKA